MVGDCPSDCVLERGAESVRPEIFPPNEGIKKSSNPFVLHRKEQFDVTPYVVQRFSN